MSSETAQEEREGGLFKQLFVMGLSGIGDLYIKLFKRPPSPKKQKRRPTSAWFDI